MSGVTDEMIEAAFRDVELPCVVSAECIRQIVKVLSPLIRDQVRKQALEDAARVCEAEAKDFLSPEYTTGQPLRSFGERFGCKTCAAAIRKMEG